MKITSSCRGFELPGVDCITQMPTSKLSENLFFCWQFIINNVLMHTDDQNNKVHVEKDWFTSQVDDDDQSANEEPPIPPARKKVQTVTELD